MAAIPSQRILVIDDEPVVRESVKMMLVYDGHSVEMANGGAEALAKFAPEKFDLVFTDYCMPLMNGEQVALELRARAPSIPIILLTAFPPTIKPKAIDLIITKPFYFDTLRDGIQRVLAKSLAQQVA